ncbi:MAG TPA: YaiO family outer membrane beta-barrel protein [Allosphingosinicella sp.]|nr:YaiO family outer membrane beta-barrel protein [Allosphingosinicella sp.]
MGIAILFLTAAQAPAQTQVQSDYDRAVAARMSGRFDTAVEILRDMVDREPNHADARLQLGLVYLALQRLDEAQLEFERTLQLAPDYADARIGLARVAERRGDRARALEYVEPLGSENAEVIDLLARLRSVPPSVYRTRLDVDLAAAALEGQPDWREASVGLSHRWNDKSSATARIEASRRFGLDDVYGELRVDHRFGPGLSAWLAVGGTPSADFRPSWQLGAGIAGRVRGGPKATVFTFDVVQASYRNGDIQTVTPGVEQYFADGKAWATLRWINVLENGDHRSGWLARGDLMAGSRLRLFAGLADAPDLSEGVVVDTFSVFGGLAADLGERTILRFSLAHDERQGSDRLTVSVGLGWRF